MTDRRYYVDLTPKLGVKIEVVKGR